ISVWSKKFSVFEPAKISVATRTRTSPLSQRSRARHGGGALGPPAAVASVGAWSDSTVCVSDITVRPFGRLQPPGHPQAEPPVERDGCQQQGARDRLVPEGRNPRRDERLIDRVEQDRAERGAEDGAAAAEDRHAAHHDGGDDEQFVAGAAR